MGVDLGGTHIRGVLADEAGSFIERRHVRTEADEGLPAVLGRIVGMVSELCGVRPGVVAIGIGAPGPIDSQAGVVSTPPNLPGWVDVPLARIVQDEVGIPAFLGNDANVAALGEYSFGAGKEVRHLVYITASTGVGGGIIVDGKLLEGQRGAAGEVGHMVVEPGGELCSCGGRGHLEALVSGTAIGRQARAALEAGCQSIVAGMGRENPSGVSGRIVTEAAKLGDPLAVELVARAGERLGYAVINLVHLFNPRMVAVGGGVSLAGERFFDPMRRVVLDGLMPVFKQDLQLVPASLGPDAGLYGSVALALRASS